MSIFKKIYEDFFKKSRLGNYEELLKSAKDKGYQMLGIFDFYTLVKSGESLTNKRIIINRHDIDTSPKVARKMFQIEKKVFGKNGSSTYYFRDSTTDTKLIKEIESYGYETGYHYESIANFIKKKRNASPLFLNNNLEDIKNLFSLELNKYKKKTNTLSRTVASHGDFINVKIGIPNYSLLADCDLRTNNNIVAEAYDEIISKNIQKRYADHILERTFVKTVCENLDCNVVMILTHPRNWKVDFIENIKANFSRLFWGVRFHFFKH